jgi:hypothetical protein
VIIEAGPVNMAMYDKGEKEDLSEREAQNFQKFIVNEAPY